MTLICYLWNSANVKWKDANWKWSECFQSPDTGSGICYLWSTADVLWKDAGWMWSKCFFPPTPPVTGSVGNLPGIDASTLIPEWLEEPWNPYRAGEQKKLGLICRVDGIKYEKEKKSKKASLSVKGVKVTIAAPDVDVKLNLEE